MKAFIGNILLSKIQPQNKRYDIWDNKLTGFMLRVFPSGVMTYRCEYARGKRITIGKSSILTPTQARDRAKEILADAVKGNDPSSPKQKTKNLLTLERFIETEYKTWRQANRKSSLDDIKRLQVNFFDEFANIPLIDISPLLVDKWRVKRVNNGTKPVTINRDVTTLKACLSKAVEWDFIQSNPLQKLKPIKTDHTPKVRFLSKSEENILKQTLQARDEQIKQARLRGNDWRNTRGYVNLPDLSPFTFGDHLTPMVLLSLNTGLRRGELFSLTWDNINLEKALLSVTGDNTKSGKTRHIPLNSIAIKTLQDWQAQTQTHGLIFPSKNGSPFSHTKRSWASVLKEAEIVNFRWHDMRHHFASKLVMAKVDLNTVRELLGHADLSMTLRYAHLAPEHKAEAVAKLV